MKTEPTIWTDCYDDGWTGFIVPDSFAHPAKYSKALIERIFDHMLAKGWICKGDRAADCFGGVATGGLIAAYRGLEWIGVELEPRFCEWGRQNINLHKSKLAYLGCPLPKIVQGDSRQFHEIVGGICGVVTSPPYADSIDRPSGIDPSKVKKPGGPNGNTFHEIYGETDGQIGRLKEGAVDAVVSSPPYNLPMSQDHNGTRGGKRGTTESETGAFVKYGSSPGQIEGIKQGDISAVITSPPYADGCQGKGTDLHPQRAGGMSNEKSARSGNNFRGGYLGAVVTSPPYSDIATGAGGLNTKPATKSGQQSGRSAKAASQGTDQKYGQSEGQISRLNGGSVEAVVTSPPYAANTKSDSLMSDDGKTRRRDLKRPFKQGHGCFRGSESYGETAVQIGKESPETYWAAMESVYASCFLAIKPGGYLACVVKDYVKDKKRVPLCDDTARLLEHCGFEIVERVHAMLVKETRHTDLFNGHTTEKRERKSFFRRLAEKKGSPPIDFEQVIFCQKPA